MTPLIGGTGLPACPSLPCPPQHGQAGRPAPQDNYLVTVVSATELLFVVSGSNGVAEIRAVSLISWPFAAVTFTVKVTVAVALDARVPMLHRTVPVSPTPGDVQVPALVETLAKVVPAGTASVTTTLVAASGPLLPAVMV